MSLENEYLLAAKPREQTSSVKQLDTAPTRACLTNNFSLRPLAPAFLHQSSRCTFAGRRAAMHIRVPTTPISLPRLYSVALAAALRKTRRRFRFVLRLQEQSSSLFLVHEGRPGGALQHNCRRDAAVAQRFAEHAPRFLPACARCDILTHLLSDRPHSRACWARVCDRVCVLL